MRPWNKVNQASAAVSNRQLVMHLLRQSGPLSRRDLARRSGLRSSTVTYIVRDLLEDKLVRAIGKRERAGAGKKQVLLDVNPDYGWVVGVGVEGESASLVFLDAHGGVIDRDRLLIRGPIDMLPRLLSTRVDNWLASHGQPAGRLLGVGAGVPGIVDPNAGLVLQSRRFRKQNWPLAELLHEAFNAPAVIDNDANLAALAEARAGSGQGLSSFLYFLINAQEQGQVYDVCSFGSTLCLDGSIFRGAHFGAGEIDTLLAGGKYGVVTAEQLLIMADADGAFDSALESLGRHIAHTLVGLVDLIDPASVILGGNLCIANRRMLHFIEEELNCRILPILQRRVRVQPSMFSDHGVSTGAGLAALHTAMVNHHRDSLAQGQSPIDPVLGTPPRSFEPA